jgi:hypothetical protein
MGDNYYKINNMLEKKLHEEVQRFREINKYARILMNEQELPPAPGGDVPPPSPDMGAAPTPDAGALPTPDMGATPPLADAQVPAIPESDTEEIDITDLVNMTKSIKKELDSKKSSTGDVEMKMNDIFTKLDGLEKHISNMDNIINKIEELGSKIENMRPKSPQEKLELRSLDSYPFNQNPQQFFAHKQDEMQQSGKNEYVLTKNDVENYSQETIKDTFNPNLDDDNEYRFNR